jgi:hypothetical protein
MVVHNEGGVPTLYVHETSGSINGQNANSYIFRWNGQAFVPTSGGGLSPIGDLCEYNDGSGNKLYAGGTFSLNGPQGPAKDMAVWDGSAWLAVGSGLFSTQLSNPHVMSMTVHDQGFGPVLVLGGFFTQAGGLPIANLATWNGQAYGPIGNPNGAVTRVASIDFGAGPELFAFGFFTQIGGQGLLNFARLKGGSWSAPTPPGNFLQIGEMLPTDLGAGPELLVGGNFGSGFNSVQRFNGSSWSSLGQGLSATITDLAVVDFGSGKQVFAASVDRLYRYGSGVWTELGVVGDPVILSGGGQINDLEVADLGNGPRLLISGAFNSLGGVYGQGLLTFDGTALQPLTLGFGGPIRALAVETSTPAPSLVVGGEFKGGSGLLLNRVARYQSGQWSALGQGFDFGVETLGFFDLGSGRDLYAGGLFTKSGTTSVGAVARFDGSNWQPLGNGLKVFGFLPGTALAMAEYDAGSGPALYVGGQFTNAGSVAAEGIARWSGSQWSAVGSGTDDPSPTTPVSALAVHDDGQGARLYAAGDFIVMGGVTANRIAAWNGSSWSALGSGINGEVKALVEFDDGSGPALYAGGLFTQAGGVPAENVARWKGGAWSPVGGGLATMWVEALAVHDAGQGPRLFAGGFGGTTLWRLEPSGWQPVPTGSTAAVNALGSMPAGPLAGLLLGTESPVVNQAGDSFLMRYGCASSNIVSWPGCSGAGPVLSTTATSAPLGQNLPILISSGPSPVGIANLHAGALAVDGAGCGLSLAPGVELLLGLVPPPQSLLITALQAGSVATTLAVPLNQNLAGKKVALQAIVGPSAPLGFELTNALEILLGP